MRTKSKLAGLLLSLAAVSWSQSQSITLSGTVTDPSGAVVQRAKIQLLNVDTGEAWTAATNETGNYFLPLIKPGRYRLTAEAPGFKQYEQTGIVLETGAPARADFRLEIGAVTESVTVEETLPLLQAGASAVGTVVNNRTIANMPLADRRAAQLARLTGFVVMTTPRNLVESGPAFEMAGGRGGDTAWLIDGGNAQFVSLGMPGLLIDPPVESMQEFNVSVSNYAAELGRTGGGVVQITTRSGTNHFHGSAYEYFRHDKLDARNFFAIEEPRLRYNLFGASLGGPIRRNKAHFFFNYEGLRENRPRTRILNIPTAAETRGDFSTSATIIRDPAAAGRPPFQANVIPSSRLDSVGARLAAFYPEPNVSGRASGNANFIRNHGTLRHSDSYVGRLDYNRSDQDRFFGRLLVFDYRQHILPVFPTSGLDPFEASSDWFRYSASATWLHLFAPTTISELRFSFNNSRHKTARPGGLDLGLAEQTGLRGTNPRFPPQINLGPRFQALGIGGGFLDDPMRSAQLANNLTHVRGNHELKFGFEWRPNTVEDVTFNQAGGTFGFGEQATGNSLASLLLGWVQQAQRNETLPARYRSLTMSAFVQDDWKVSSRLTLNLGLRWDWDQPRWEEIDNRQNSFDRFATNPVSGTPGIVTFAGRNGLSKFAHRHDWNNFGPRVGFAWRVTDNWVVRGGGSIVYSPQYAAVFGGVPGGPANLGFSIQGAFASADMGITPPFLLRDGLPPVSAPPETALTPGFGAVAPGRQPNTQVVFFEPDRRSGYLETFSFNIQRKLTSNLLAEVGYLATLGHKLVTIVPFTINQLRPELMGPGNRQNLRPFPQFTNVQVANPTIGNSNYHGMNLRIEKRFSRGLQFQANYTWSRFIDDVVALSELGAGSAFTNVYDRRGDRGLAGNHVSHRFIWSSVWDLPFGPARALHVSHPFWKQVLGGWSTGLIAELRTGPPYGVTDVSGPAAFSPSQRPNVIGDPKITGSRSRGEQVEQWFNTAAFAQPAPFTFGNAGRTAGYGPGAIIMDLSILKGFHLKEQHRLEFRTEMLNFINHANFALQPQNLARGNAAFGRLTGLLPGNQSRIIQLGLHYRF